MNGGSSEVGGDGSTAAKAAKKKFVPKVRYIPDLPSIVQSRRLGLDGNALEQRMAKIKSLCWPAHLPLLPEQLESGRTGPNASPSPATKRQSKGGGGKGAGSFAQPQGEATDQLDFQLDAYAKFNGTMLTGLMGSGQP